MIRPRTPPDARDVARHYGELDRYYRELWGEHVHHGLWRTPGASPEEAVLALVRHVAELAGVGPGDAVCDVGSGYGATARWLVRERGARVTAMTLSPTQHAHAVAAEAGARGGPVDDRRPGGPRYVLGDWLENGEPSDAYDVVLVVECLSHLTDVERALAEMVRVLRPGGRFVACVWLAREGTRPWEVRYLLRPICEEGRLARLLTVGELGAMLAAAGLEVAEVEDVSREVARTWTVCLARAVRRVVADPAARRFLGDPSQPERVFARTLLRLRLAYATGSLRYGIVRAVKPRAVALEDG